MTIPTPGRVVLYWPSTSDVINMPGIRVLDPNVPFAAEVVFVNADDTVNLAVKDHAGQPFTRQNVRLKADDGSKAIWSAPFCEWPWPQVTPRGALAMPLITKEAKSASQRAGGKAAP